MNFTYTTGIPAGSHNLSDDQPPMKVNTDSVAGIVAIDHYGFANSAGGYHKQVTFGGSNVPSVPTTTPVLFANIQDGKGNTLPSSIPQLFFYSGTDVQGQNNYISLGTGSTLLPGGIIMKWGPGNAGFNGAGNTFASPFPNACFSVTCTHHGATNSPGTIAVNALSTTGFTAYNGSSLPIYYIAIGN